MFIHKTLNLTIPPEWLINHAFSLLPDITNERETILKKHGYDILKAKHEILQEPHNNVFRKINYNGEILLHAQINFLDLGNESLNWVKENIESSINMFEISYTTVNRKISGAHTDTTDGYVFIYPLDTGGDNVKTVFYKEKGCNLVRESRLIYNDYNNLEKIDEIILQPQKWTIFNTRVIHAVEGMERSRILLQARNFCYDFNNPLIQ